jgi:hypothetical protein
MSVFADWENQAVTIRALTGSGGMGNVYAPAVEVQALVDESSRLVRGPDGAEVVSTATVYCPVGTVAPPGSLVQLPGEDLERQVITRSRPQTGDPDLDGVDLALT